MKLRKPNIFDLRRGLVRMSWGLTPTLVLMQQFRRFPLPPRPGNHASTPVPSSSVAAADMMNNIPLRRAFERLDQDGGAISLPPPSNDLSRVGLFKQRWVAKRDTRAYHGAGVTEKQLITRHFRPDIKLPDLKNSDQLPPISMLAFAELERRLDIALFRACFCQSVWQARRNITKGHVRVNGEVVRQPSYILQDGDIFTIDPIVVPTLKAPVTKLQTTEKQAEKVESSETVASSETVESSETLNTSETPEEAKQPATPVKQRQFSYPNVKSKKSALAQGQELVFNEVPFMQPFAFIPEYLEVNFNTCSAAFLRTPTVQPGRCELPSPLPPVQHSLAYEWYSRTWKRKAFSVIQQRLVAKKKRISAAKLRPRSKFQKAGGFVGRGPVNANKPGTMVVMGRQVKLKRNFERIARQDQIRLGLQL